MITVIRSKDGTIKTYSEHLFESYNLVLGESVEVLDTTMEAYAGRFRLICMGKTGETVTVQIGDPAVVVQVECPLVNTVDVNINGSIETLTPTGGVAEIVLSTQVPGVFVIQPADRTRYCAAGVGLLVVEVNQ